MSIRRRIKVEQRDRKEVLEEAVISQDEFFDKFFANPAGFQWFFGAGVSRSSGVPLAQEIVDEVIVKVWEKVNPAKRGTAEAEELREWVNREKWFNPNFAYISALEKEYPSTYLRTELFKRYMRGKFPTPAQLMFAIGVKEEKLANRLYTTNWDTLSEDAFYWLRGTNCVTIKKLDKLRDVKDFDHRYVIKIHNDLDQYEVRYLREGIAKHNDDLRDFLVESMANTGLVVLGYSGMEYSVMNMLQEIVHDHEEVLNGGLYWAYRGNIKHIPEPITDLMAIGLEKGKDFRIFEASEADFLMAHISRTLKFNSIEEELAVTFNRFNKMGYGELRSRLPRSLPQLKDLVHRDLLDEGFLVRDFNAIYEQMNQEMKGLFTKKEVKEQAKRAAEAKLINHCFNDLNHENYADAEVKLKKVQSDYPENEMVYWGLGWGQFRTGRYEEAQASFDQALKINPKNYNTYIAKALCYQAANETEKEIETYGKVLEIKGDLDLIWYNRGVAASELKRYDLEFECYESARSINGGNYAAWYNLGLCHYSSGRNLEAISCFNRAKEINRNLFNAVYNAGILLGKLGQDSQALTNFDSCIQLREDDDESFRSRGIAEVMTGQDAQAMESYMEYFAIDELGREPTANADDDKSWANYGLSLYGENHLPDAMHFTQKYLDKNTDDARVWYNKALIHYKQDEPEAAMAAFDKSLALDDDYDMVWYRKALLMGEMGQYEGEIELLTRFLDRNEQDLRGWFELGEANRKLAEAQSETAPRQKYYAAAVDAYDHALEVNRSHLPTWLRKTICLNHLHRYEEALECIDYLMRYDRENPEMHYQKGLALDGLGDQLAATDALSECLKINEDHEDANYLRALLLAELEQFAKAVDHLDKVIELNPDRWQAYHYKGVCIIKQREYEKALKVFEDALGKFRGNPRFMVDQALAYIMMNETDTAREKLRGAVAIDDSLKEELQTTPEFAGLVL
jgi:tetratricopeptide (TPR) repeat protein